MGEKGNLAPDPVAALDAIPLDVLKGSPETVNAWLDTYLKAREVHELGRAAEAAEAGKEAGPKAGGGGAAHPTGKSPA